MKKRTTMKKGVLAGGVLLASSILSGCVRPAQPVYGPGPDQGNEGPAFHEEDNLPAPVYGPAPDFDVEFDPEDNIPEDVYGPPAWEEDVEPSAQEGTGGQN